MNMDLFVVHLFYHPKKIMKIYLMIKSLKQKGKKVNLTNMGNPIQPRWHYLLSMIFLVAHSYYYLKNMEKISRSVLLQWLMNMEKNWNTTQVISSS